MYVITWALPTLTLLLRWWNLFHHDSWDCIPTRICVTPATGASVSVAGTNIEPHGHRSFRNPLAHSHNAANPVDIFVSWSCAIAHVDQTVNCFWWSTLWAVKGEKPSATAVVAASDAKGTIPGNTQASVRWILVKNTFLQIKKEKKSETEITDVLILERLRPSLKVECASGPQPVAIFLDKFSLWTFQVRFSFI